ncbi:MAG: ribosome biogenesis GTPase Der [Thermodesulfobacteriota bacterium]
MKPIVAIVGRPNVGKSVLFNKLIGRRKAITKDEPGVTRDLNYADCEERGRLFTLVDTGGFEPEATEGIQRQVREQARLAVEEADAIVFVMDGRSGPMPGDREIVDMLRRSGKPVVYGVNKLDTAAAGDIVSDFYTLGMDEALPLSAEHGLGISELLDEVLARLPEAEPVEVGEEGIKVAIVGRPNAGKSSLLNRLIGRERSIVSDTPGTTRDSIDTVFEHGGRTHLFIDTAGIRKKNRISRKLEAYCAMEAIRSIDRCDVVLLVIDGREGVKSQDESIAGLIEKSGKACVIVINKWDVVEKDTGTTGKFIEEIRRTIPFLSFAPVLFVSALSGQRTGKVFETVERVNERGGREFPTSMVNKLLKEITARHSHPLHGNRSVKFYYTTQTGIRPQAFTVFANHPRAVLESYRRYLVNSLRESLELGEVPLRVFFRKRH